MNALADSKTEKVAELIRAYFASPLERLLVVGCGDGIEAAILANDLNTHVTGIDLEGRFDREAAKLADLRRGDASKMEFGDASFDFVYCYHVLEHVAEPRSSIAEIARVLRPGGGFWIGTPNRSRLIGYLGAKNATVAQKIAMNKADLKARLRRKFRNEYGAHAGFTKRELETLIISSFPSARDTTLQYYLALYPGYSVIIRVLNFIGLSRFLFPCVYFVGTRPE
jgi:ubiquinone/menaquinone biosynthesis C-methylase UbiE